MDRTGWPGMAERRGARNHRPEKGNIPRIQSKRMGKARQLRRASPDGETLSERRPGNARNFIPLLMLMTWLPGHVFLESTRHDGRRISMN
ncbi:MAG: hypothetical protein HYY78_13835 [Betaproteobacteria bacterium]|nr:hypothetical protein [Betaproteobacteria bacterium]